MAQCYLLNTILFVCGMQAIAQELLRRVIKSAVLGIKKISTPSTVSCTLLTGGVDTTLSETAKPTISASIGHLTKQLTLRCGLYSMEAKF